MDFRGVGLMNKFSCIILAGGMGTRFGEKKQFVEWKGKPLWKHVYDKCITISDDVIVVGIAVSSGITRQKSVWNGLQEVRYNTVVILEAARPNVTIEQIKYIASQVSKRNPSVSYYLPSTETIYVKYIGHMKRINSFQLQVPQAFNTMILKYCHKESLEIDSTSDTEIIQNIIGIEPLLIEGGINLFKITYKIDLDILGVLMNESK